MSYKFSFAIGTISTVKLPTLVQQLGQYNGYPAQPRDWKSSLPMAKISKWFKVLNQPCQAGSCLAFAAEDPLPQMKSATELKCSAKLKKDAKRVETSRCEETGWDNKSSHQLCFPLEAAPCLFDFLKHGLRIKALMQYHHMYLARRQNYMVHGSISWSHAPSSRTWATPTSRSTSNWRDKRVQQKCTRASTAGFNGFNSKALWNVL